MDFNSPWECNNMGKRVRLCLVMVAITIIASNVSDVSALWSGNATPSYDDSDTYETTSGEYHTVDADAISGICEIQVNPKVWPLWYGAGLYGEAWVAQDVEMSETITSTWYFTAQWDIDFRLNCGWGGKVKIEVRFLVMDANEDEKESKSAWSYRFTGPAFNWDDYEDVNTDDSETEGFSCNLYSGYTYKFAAVLRVTVMNNSGAIDVNARTDNYAPAELTVDQITWSETAPD